MSRALVVLVALVAAAASAPPPSAREPSAQAPARDSSARRATGTCVIRGRVTEAGTDRPLSRVDIRAIAPGVSEPHAVKTDGNGRYEISGLPPGRYVVAASKTNYLTTSFGATRVMGPGKGFDIAAGQTADEINFALPHAGAIAGEVVDEFGDPVSDAQVMTMRFQYVNGERRMVRTSGNATTNDIGEFRVFGLPPGDYFVAATLRTPSSNEDGVLPAYAPTFYPGTGDAGQAQRIAIDAGRTVANVVLPLLPVLPTRIRGSVTDSKGRPMTTGFINVTRQIGGTMVDGFGSGISPDGTFTIDNVTPGDYVVRAGNGAGESAAAKVSVNGSEVSGVQLITAPASTILGRIAFEAGAAPLKASAVHLNAVPAIPWLGPTNVTVHDDLTFEIKTVPGHLLLRTPNPGPRWRLSRVVADGVDVTDAGLDVAPNTTVSNVVVEMTHHVAELSGHVVKSDGQTTRDAYVIIFTQDSARWTTQSRHVAVSRPAGDDRFRVLLPGGDYFIFATTDVEPGQWTDPAFLARIREHAAAVSIATDEKKAIDVALASTPEP